jgi:hypothetical protein
MELAELLDATVTVPVEFNRHTFDIEVYTAGTDRLPYAVRENIEGQLKGPEGEDDKAAYQRILSYTRKGLPWLIKSWSLTKDGLPLPITEETFSPEGDTPEQVPPAMMLAIGTKCQEVWKDPTSGEESQISSPQMVNAEPHQTESILPI